MINFRGYLNDWWHALRHHWRVGDSVVTWVIVALCTVIWLVEVILRNLSPLAFSWLITNGAFMPALAVAKPWTWLTSMFLHAPNFTHVLFNMLTLIVIGPFMEGLMGHWCFLALYLMCGLGGADGLMVYSALTNDWFISAYGASDALFGLFAAVLIVGRHTTGMDVRGMAVCIAINFAMPLVIPNIAWQSHVGGFVVGLVYTWLLLDGVPALRRRSLPVRIAVYGVPMALLLVGLALMPFASGGGLIAGLGH
ncbi:Membrane associated serine protease, rhomboid family [Bifidobacterium bohemicum]|uniref:Membrane protein in rhomboid family protein n=1 Tax=Bifidobacterium bohemicum DSM 22767 TaxID=1437606 RepID=A0A086ZH67_9BIFI|nr:rhomboid family intramembrane serine protease [Bifidobacterium bohemicum]KFI45867.1 membrane protein in rhomboid family protein [Bifidobacterium bohemicum DSM 22767]SCC15944.1 Membrane associated serine protease, rhomboid family [Bifidobacterium bohemicum]